MDKVKIPPFGVTVPALPHEWMDCIRTDFGPNDVSDKWKSAVRAPPSLRESSDEKQGTTSVSE